MARLPTRAFAAVAGATAVLAGCLATAPLFLSTAATAAARLDLQGRCPGKVAANASGRYEARTQIVSTLDRAALGVAHAGEPIVTDQSTQLGLTLPRDDGVFRSASVAHRTGGAERLQILTRAGTNGVLAPDWFAAEFHVSAGESLGLAVSGGSRREVPVIGVYRDVESGPGLPAWCVLEPAFATNQFGDHRPPVLIFDDAGARTYRGLFAHGETRWELPFAGSPTASTAATYLRDLAPARAAGTRIGAPVAGDLDFVVHRAAQIRSFTSASIAPVRWSGALTGTGLVVAAALLFARRNRRELRIRVVRGARPALLGAEAAVRLAPPALAGAVAGLSAAAFLVRTFGPSSDLDTRGRLDAVWLSLLGVAVALAAVAVTVAVSSRAFDRQRPPRPSRLRWVPFELVAAVVSFVAFRHLAHSGGVKLAGADASSVDPWAVLFPLLLVWTVLLALGRPAVAALRRLRTLGAGARPHVMLGVRRAVNDPAVGLVTCGAVALCLTTFVYASTLSTSIDSSLRAKAHMFAGADERVGMTSVEQLDPSLAGHATVVTRGQGTFGGVAVTVLGVDPATFAKVAYWPRSFGSLSRYIDVLDEPPGNEAPVPVVIAGPVPPVGAPLLDQGTRVAVRVVGRARLWPTMQSGDTFVVAPRAALEARHIGGYDEVWLRDVPHFTPSLLTRGGAGVIYTVDLSSVLDFNNALPVRWSLGLLAALGAVAGLAFAAVELAIVDARARGRQLTFVLWRRMGLDARAHRLSCLIELGFPALIGAVTAVVVALATARIVVARLDALAAIPPPNAFVFSARPCTIGGVVVAVLVVALASWSQRVTRSGDPMELVRVAE